MDKPLASTSLYDLICLFDEAYKNCGQRLIKVRVGGLISHDPHSIATIPWKGITIYPRAEEPHEAKQKTDRYSRELRSFLRTKQ